MNTRAYDVLSIYIFTTLWIYVCRYSVQIKSLLWKWINHWALDGRLSSCYIFSAFRYLTLIYTTNIQHSLVPWPSYPSIRRLQY